MSGKKHGSTSVMWMNCRNCGYLYPNRTILHKHNESNCYKVYPCIRNDGIPLFELGTLQQNQIREYAYAIDKIEDHRHFLMLNFALFQELKLKSLDWVQVSFFDSETDIFSSKLKLAVQVWGCQRTLPLKAFFSPSVLKSYPTELNSKNPIVVTRIEEQPLLLQKLVLELNKDLNTYPQSLLQSVFRNSFKAQRFLCGSSFVVQFLTFDVLTKVVETYPVSNKDQFCWITAETVIKFQTLGISSDPAEESEELRLDDVGGLSNEKLELQQSVFHSLNSFKSVSSGSRRYVTRGILVHGHHGTGKTLIIRALCNTFKISQFWLKDTSTKSLRDIFFEASHKECNSAVIIDNLDILCSVRDVGDSQLEFAEELRLQIQALGEVPVIILATAVDIEQIPESVRTFQVFGKEIELPVPSEDGRNDILKKILQRLPNELTESEIQILASQAHGFVGGDLASLRMSAVRLADSNIPSFDHFKEALRHTSPSAMKSFLLEIPKVHWDDIGGMDDLKYQLKQSVEWPRKHPEAFTRFKIQPPKGILMYGPPGCSKTMIAKALATESHLNFLSVKGSDLFSKWVGESEKSVKALFRKARQVAPAILFFDELDALGCERGQQGGSSNVHERVLAQILVEIDGIEQLKDVLIVAATNRPDLIDKALTRPGRLDRLVYVSLPNTNTRKEIFRIKLRGMPINENVSIESLVEMSEGYSGAEITGICQEAGLKALERSIDASEVSMEDFISAFQKCPRRISKELITFYNEYSSSQKHL